MYAYGCVLATLDRRITGNDDEFVEIKTTGKRIVEPLRSWWWQVQAQLLCTGMVRCHLVVLDATMDLQVFAIDSDHDAQTELYERAAKFMEHIGRGEVPPDADLTYAQRTMLTPVDDGSSVPLTEADAELVARLAVVRTYKRGAEAEEERVKALLAERLGMASTGTYDDKPLVVWKTQHRRTLDQHRLANERPGIVQEFTRETSVRVMKVVTR
jgi:predicted phage-related endonuclease